MKKAVIYILLTLAVTGFSLQGNAQSTKSITLHPDTYFSLTNEMISMARKYIGTPYVYGGKTAKGFDCSGFMYFLFKEFGYTISPSSRELYTFGQKVDKGCVQIGDFAFFKGRKSSSIGHVALLIGVNGDQFDIIHATNGKGITIDHNFMSLSYYKSRFLSFRRPFDFCWD